LLSEIGSDVDGLFLGRFAHDPSAVAAILDEAETVANGETR
jgi:triosephosphate isomerase